MAAQNRLLAVKFQLPNRVTPVKDKGDLAKRGKETRGGSVIPSDCAEQRNHVALHAEWDHYTALHGLTLDHLYLLSTCPRNPEPHNPAKSRTDNHISVFLLLLLLLL